MADVKWIKIVTDIFGNRKIKQIEAMPEADTILVVWFKLLCLAGNINECGLVTITKDIPYTDEMLANEFRRPLNTVRLALATFEQFGMIEIVDNILCVSNWEKYQNTDSLEKMREQTRIRNIKYREKQKALRDVSVTSHDATEEERERDKEGDKDKDKEERGTDKPSSPRFIPPSLEDASTYCQERNNGIDPQHFIDYYSARGWKLGKEKMKDWKAAIRTWEKRNSQEASSGKAANTDTRKSADEKWGIKPSFTIGD
jgi:predicted phage replisome organizer